MDIADNDFLYLLGGEVVVEVEGVQVISHVRVSVDKCGSIPTLLSSGRVALECHLVGQNGINHLDILQVLQS